MSTNVLDQPVSIQAHLLSRIISGLVILVLLFDAANKFAPWSAVTEAMDRIGYGSSDALARALGIISLAYTALCTVPPTSILGAILWTGYFSDVVVSHLRIF